MNNKYILSVLNIIINNLIPLSYRSNIKNKEDIRLSKIIENVIKLWETSGYNIDNIIYTLNDKITNKEILFINSIDDYVPFSTYMIIISQYFEIESS
jgi:hypothetical protein